MGVMGIIRLTRSWPGVVARGTIDTVLNTHTKVYLVALVC